MRFTYPLLVILLLASTLLFDCNKKNTVIIEYNQPFNFPTFNDNTFPDGGLGTYIDSGGAIVVYDIVRVLNLGKDAILFTLEPDKFTTDRRLKHGGFKLQSINIPKSMQEHVVTIKTPVPIKPGETATINGRILLFVPMSGTIQDRKQLEYENLRYIDPNRSLSVGRKSPIVKPQVLDPATWQIIKP